MFLSTDTEDTGLSHLHGDRPFIVGIFDENQRGHYWRWEVDPFTRQPKTNKADLEEIAHAYHGNDIVFHNAGYDLRALASIGLYLSFENPHKMHFTRGRLPAPPWGKMHVPCGTLHDTQILSHTTISEGAGGSHALKNLALHYLDYSTEDEKELHRATVGARLRGKELGWSLGVNLDGERAVDADYWMPRAIYDYCSRPNHKLNFDCPPSWKTLAADYNICDCERTLGLFFFLQGICEREGLWENYEREIKLIEVTYRMEDWGMGVNSGRLTELTTRFEQKTDHFRNSAKAAARKHFKLDLNVNASLQIVEVMKRANLTLPPTTDKGNVVTSAQALAKVAQLAEFSSNPKKAAGARILRDIVGYNTDFGDEENIPAYRTYVGATRFLSNYRNYLLRDRIHPSFNQTGTKFTRYSSSSPNGQNVSKKAAIPLRYVYGPPPGYIWLDPDYSQLELRIFAYAAQDERMIEAFELGYDFHQFVAEKMYRTPHPTPEQRRNAKAVNFKAIYGGLNNVPPEYAAQFPTAAAFMASVVSQVHQCGYIHTLGGRRIYIDPEKAYVGVDAICQGTAGEIVKNAMQACHDLRLVDWDSSAIIANIHDEIIFELPAHYPYKPIARRIQKVMEQAGTDLGVVTPVDMAIVRERSNWAAVEKLNLAGKRHVSPT